MISLGSRFDSVTTHDYSFVREHWDLAMIHADADVFTQWQPDVAVVSDCQPAMDALAAALSGFEPSAERQLGEMHFTPRKLNSQTSTGLKSMAMSISHRFWGTFALLFRMTPSWCLMRALLDAGYIGFIPFSKPDSCLGPVSGAMGYGVPGGIGAIWLPGGRPVFTCRDGGFDDRSRSSDGRQEKLPLKIIVCDNSAWGSIAVSAESAFRRYGVGTRLESPDFTALGNGYG